MTTTSRVIFIDICGQVGSVGSLLDPGFKSYLHEPHIAHKAQIPQFSTRSLGCKVQVKQLWLSVETGTVSNLYACNFFQLLEGMTQFEHSERRQQELQKELKDQKVV